MTAAGGFFFGGSAAVFLILGVDTFNSENFKRNWTFIIKIASDMATPNFFLQAKRHEKCVRIDGHMNGSTEGHMDIRMRRDKP